MNAIMGISDLLAKTALTPEQDKFVQIVRRASDNLLNLINDILDLSKVEASQLELEQTGFPLADHLEKGSQNAGRYEGPENPGSRPADEYRHRQSDGCQPDTDGAV